MVNTWNPWAIRGGNWNNGAGAGAFSFNTTNGNANSNVSFRVVLLDYKRKMDFCRVYSYILKKRDQ